MTEAYLDWRLTAAAHVLAVHLWDAKLEAYPQEGDRTWPAQDAATKTRYITIAAEVLKTLQPAPAQAEQCRMAKATLERPAPTRQTCCESRSPDGDGLPTEKGLQESTAAKERIANSEVLLRQQARLHAGAGATEQRIVVKEAAGSEPAGSHPSLKQNPPSDLFQQAMNITRWHAKHVLGIKQ